MAAGLAVIILAFAWLMYETKFLTVRLLRYSKPLTVMDLMMGMISIVIGITLMPIIEKAVGEILSGNGEDEESDITATNPDSLDAPRN